MGGNGVLELFQHASIGQFIGSTLEGVESGFIRCVYTAKNTFNRNVTILCDKNQGCCDNGCCPKDQFWMTGVFVLLGFAILIFIIGACFMVVCYWRTKSLQRKEEKEFFDHRSYVSQATMYPERIAAYNHEATTGSSQF